MYKVNNVGDWSNGMIGVSKTFGGSSILSSPAFSIDLNACKYRCFGLFLFYKKERLKDKPNRLSRHKKMYYNKRIL